MLQKNIEKAERRARRKPTIPYTRKGPTKKGLLRAADHKYKKVYEGA